MDKMLKLLTSGMAPSAIITLGTMFVLNRMDMEVAELVKVTGLSHGELDHAGVTLRVAGLASYRRGRITIVSDEWKQPAVLPVVPVVVAEVLEPVKPVEVPVEKKKKRGFFNR